MPPTALIVDFGGVLTTNLWESIRGFTRRRGLPDNAIIDLISTHDPAGRARYTALERGEVSQHDFEQHVATTLGISAEGVLAGMGADLRPDQTMLDTVAALRAGGVRVAVLSNSWGSGYFDPYRGWHLDDRADVVVISDQVGIRKPDPAIFELTVDKLGVPATGCVFVDDIATNLEPARNMGMQVIHHTDPHTTVAALRRLFATASGQAVASVRRPCSP